MRIASLGHAIFAAALVALGIIGLVHSQYAGVWQPIAQDPHLRITLTYLCASLSIACGIGLLFQRTAVIASRVLLASFLLWMLLFRIRPIVLAPTSQEPWSGFGETAVMLAAAWVLFAIFASTWDRTHLTGATGRSGLRIGRLFFAAALIPFGTAHFFYLKETAALVPAWLPAHLFLAGFTGSAFLLAALAIFTGIGAKLAATLTAVQLGLFTLLVWFPIMAAGHRSTGDWSETVISAALTAAAWVVADSYRSLRHVPLS